MRQLTKFEEVKILGFFIFLFHEYLLWINTSSVISCYQCVSSFTTYSTDKNKMIQNLKDIKETTNVYLFYKRTKGVVTFL